jgi:hypothetical protein
MNYNKNNDKGEYNLEGETLNSNSSIEKGLFVNVTKNKDNNFEENNDYGIYCYLMMQEPSLEI